MSILDLPERLLESTNIRVDSACLVSVARIIYVGINLHNPDELYDAALTTEFSYGNYHIFSPQGLHLKANCYIAVWKSM